MIEKTVLDHLTTALAGVGSDPGVPVGMERPSPLAPMYVVIEKTGSGEANRLLRATLAVQSVAPTLYEAAVLNERVKTAMRQLPGVSADVFRVECDSDYNFTDPETKERRYQAVFNIFYLE